MKNINTKVVIGGVVVLIAVLLIGVKMLDNNSSGITPTSEVAYTTATGDNGKDEAPNFTLNKVKGDSITLSDYKGEKAVVLDFFATWCPNCRRDMPKLNKLYDKYKDQVEVIGVNLQEDENKVEEFVKEYGLDFPIVMDPNGQVSRSYGVPYTNYHVLINKEGNIAGIVPGDISELHIRELIE
jgi:peroxiredoxin